jgi:hypothetical protein
MMETLPAPTVGDAIAAYTIIGRLLQSATIGIEEAGRSLVIDARPVRLTGAEPLATINDSRRPKRFAGGK